MDAAHPGISFSYDAVEGCFAVRRAVFMEEQGFVHEFDGVDEDPSTLHIAAMRGGGCVGCIRAFPSDVGSTSHPSPLSETAVQPLAAASSDDAIRSPGRRACWCLGRLAVLPGERGQGIGTALVREAERACADQGAESIVLHAQLARQGFYEELGYARFGEVDEDEGVPHIWMRKDLD